MEIKDRTCKGCIHYKTEEKMCSLWNVPIGNENTQTCGRFELAKEFKNFGLIKLEPHHKIKYEYQRFEVIDTKYNLVVYEEYNDSFYFTKYIMIKEKKYPSELYKIHFWKASPFDKEKDKFAFYIERQYSHFRYSWPSDKITVSSSEKDRIINLESVLEIQKIKESILNKQPLPRIGEKPTIIEIEIGIKIELLGYEK
jgi:hypothetical protein